MHVHQCLLWLVFPLIVSAFKGDWDCKSSICVAAVAESGVVTYELSTSLANVDWVGIGFGEQMVNTHFVVLWKNPVDESIVLSQRYARAHTEPLVVDSPPRVARVVQPTGLLSSASPPVTFAFEIPLQDNSTQSQGHIYALSYNSWHVKASKINLADPTTHLPFHKHAGPIMLNLSNDFVPPPTHPLSTPDSTTVTKPYSRVESLILLHAFLVSFGFLVLLPIGALLARYARVFKVKWFPLHWFINFYIAAPIITLGVLLGPLIVYSKETYRIHFANGHEIIGIFLLIFYYIQVTLGRYIHERKVRLTKLGPITHHHPPLNILHIVLGVTLITVAFCQVYTGMQWWELVTRRGPITNWALPMWKTWILILFIAYIGGYTLLPRQLRMEQEGSRGAYMPVGVDNSSAEGQSAPLLEGEQQATSSRDD